MALRLADLEVGRRFEEVVVDDLSRTRVVMYAGASGDFQPLHSDEPYARASGFPGTFAHGMLTMGLAAKVLTHTFGADRLLRYRARFLATVWPGDTLRAIATVRALDAAQRRAEFSIEVVDDAGACVMRGEASVRVAP